MRILHADTDDIANPLRGGAAVRTFEVNSRLSAAHDITVMTATYPGSVRQVRRGNLSYRRLGTTIPRWGLSSHLTYLARLGSAVRHLPHDLVVEEFMPPTGFAMLPWRTSKPVICLVQWFMFDLWEQRYRLPLERMMRGLSRLARYRYFIVQSDAMRDYFAELLPKAHLWKLGCGVEDHLFRTPDARDGNGALFLGRLSIEHKGLDLLLEAWRMLKEAGAVVPLRIVGEGPGRAFLEAKIAAYGLSEHVTLLGMLEGEHKRAALHACSFLVMPSRVETFGIVALEAMAAAKPVIAFDIDHLNEVLSPQWSVLAPAFDVGSIVKAVLRLWRQPEECAQLGAAAHSAAMGRSWSDVARKQEAIYEEVGALARIEGGENENRNLSALDLPSWRN